MNIPDEVPVAICYLNQADDDRNCCWLTSHHLYVRLKGKARRFDLDRVTQLTIESRRWWFPVVAGGILAPLSLLAILLNLYNPWWLISLLVGSMLLWYWGASQHTVLAVHQPHHRQDVALPVVPPGLRDFVQFTNRFLRQGIPPLYLLADSYYWQEAQRTGIYAPPSLREQGFIPAYSKKQQELSQSNTQLWLALDPSKISAPIRYVAAEDQLVPRIYGSISTVALNSAEGH